MKERSDKVGFYFFVLSWNQFWPVKKEETKIGEEIYFVLLLFILSSEERKITCTVWNEKSIVKKAIRREECFLERMV